MNPRIGFIAISGTRVHDPELAALGLTLPGFVRRHKEIAALPSLGLLTLAGMTPDDWPAEYVELPDAAGRPSLAGDFDVVAISALGAAIRDAYDMADRCRAAGVRVILGGLHVSAVPDEAARHADAVVIGEGEPVWPAIVEDLRHGRLQPRYDARTRPFDLADAPMPRFELLGADRYNRFSVQTQRGCPYRCDFCAASIRIAPRFTSKPVPKVVAEVRRIKSLWRDPFIEFADDNTFADKRHGRELMRALAPEGVRWFTETDVSFGDDPELVSLAADAGCAQVLIGFESSQPEALAGLELRSNWKRRQLDGYHRAIETIQGRGITVNGCFVLGLDGTDVSSFDRVWEFVQQSGLYDVQVTLLTAFPGTPMHERLEREGRLLRPGAWELCTLFDVNVRPRGMSVEELTSGFRWLVERLYSAEATAARRQRFLGQRTSAAGRLAAGRGGAR